MLFCFQRDNLGFQVDKATRGKALGKKLNWSQIYTNSLDEG